LQSGNVVSKPQSFASQAQLSCEVPNQKERQHRKPPQSRLFHLPGNLLGPNVQPVERLVLG
jgi:hypothetical protein